MTSVSASAHSLPDGLAAGTLAGTWTLDADRSHIRFTTRAMFGLVGVNGSFTAVSGAAEVSTAGDVGGRLVIDTAAIATKMKKRDAHLRTADFFDAETYPTLTFVANDLHPTSDDLTITGSLTIRDVTKPISVTGRIVSLTNNEAVLDATAVIDRSDFGLDFRKMGARDMINNVEVRAVFTRG